MKGVGIDLASKDELQRLADTLSEGAFARLFTAAERKAAEKAPDRMMYLTTRFAAKEAVYKAIAPIKGGIGFDLRIVETLNRPDGSPYVSRDGKFEEVLEKAEITQILISITTVDHYAQAIALVE